MSSADFLGGRRLIPVVVIDDAAAAVPLAEAFLAGGLDIIEVTLRTEAGFKAIESIRESCPKMIVGAGTVLTLLDAERVLGFGVDFGVAPGLNPQTVSVFQNAGVPFMPGVMTPSEVEKALSLELGLLKFFPAGTAGGPEALKALAGPYARTGLRFCPTGGVSLKNMKDYLSLTAVAAVGGSWLASAAQIAAGDWDGVTKQVKEALAAAASTA